MNKFEVVKRYGYREARVKPGFIFPRDVFKEVEENLIEQSEGIRSNHIVFLVESKPDGCGSELVAFYFHDFVVIIGREEDIVIGK